MSQSSNLNPSSNKTFWAIVPAAGVGARMQADRPKQYLELLGKTLIEHSLQRLLDLPAIAGAVVALDEQDAYWPQLQFTHTKPVLIAAGGKERCHSVLNALRHLEQTLTQTPAPLMGAGWGEGDNNINGFAIDTPHPNPLGNSSRRCATSCIRAVVPQGEREENFAHSSRRREIEEVWVLVHDAARPCVRAEDLNKLIELASQDDHGGLLALPVRDTMKRQTPEGRVEATVDRNGLWHAMTPQMFKLSILINSLSQSPEKKLHVTDDASAMELAGYHPLLVACHEDNIKITRPFDLTLASLYMQQQAASK